MDLLNLNSIIVHCVRKMILSGDRPSPSVYISLSIFYTMIYGNISLNINLNILKLSLYIANNIIPKQIIFYEQYFLNFNIKTNMFVLTKIHHKY